MSERLPTGGQHRQLWTAVAERGDEVAHAGQQVFAVVEHEQLRAGAEQRSAGRQDVAVNDVQVERRSERLGDGGWVGDRCERHDGDVVGSGGDLRRQGGLADTAGAEHGDQSLVGEQSLHRRQLGVATPQAARRARQ